ncbi:MAG TPA: hypothetical protein VF981_13425 [Gemmatimonadaceae bacterium]
MLHLAAPLFFGAFLSVPGVAQTPVRTRDASFAIVRYETGLTAGALTLYEAVVLATERATRSAYGLVSVFDDGRLSMQAGVEGARRSAAIAVDPRFSPLFTSIRGEVLVDAATTIQSGFMPTAQATGRARIRFERADQGAYAEIAVARAFDGRFWRNIMLGEAYAFVRRGTLEAALSATPMQLGTGDRLVDSEARVTWLRERAILGVSLGARGGEALRGNSAWGGLSATFPVWNELYATVNAGSYPADLIQNLPAGRYLAFGLRLPDGWLPPYRRPLLPAPPRPRRPELPVTARLALVVGPALDSTDIREIRVWAPGARVVEIMADFVDWIPVPLIRQDSGEWRGYYRVPPGLHRLNIRLDGSEMDAPVNWPLEQDEFIGMVALVMVR